MERNAIFATGGRKRLVDHSLLPPSGKRSFSSDHTHTWQKKKVRAMLMKMRVIYVRL
jgi:hypothetical protein